MCLKCRLHNGGGNHDGFIKWKHFPRYWPSVRGIHRSWVDSPHKGQWHGDLMFSLICAWRNGWANYQEAGDLRRHRARYDVAVMLWFSPLYAYQQGWLCVWVEPMRDDVTMWRRLLLAEPVPRMISVSVISIWSVHWIKSCYWEMVLGDFAFYDTEIGCMLYSNSFAIPLAPFTDMV